MICQFCSQEYNGYRTTRHCSAVCSVMNKSIYDEATQCRNFTGHTEVGGYGVIRFRCKDIKAHRVTWEGINGPIPKGKIVRHKCDNPGCVNPDHMELGTHAENSRDMTDRNRQAKGEKNAAAKLTEDNVKEIRILRSLGMGLSELARQYKVTPTLIQSIDKRKIWKHI